MSASAKLQINHLRSTGAVAEPVVARLALEALASELADAQTQIPPQAVLIVRRLSLAVGPDTLSRYPDPATRNRFARQGQQALALAASSAARPALEAVSPQAEAVLFADEAEMLACLGRDGLAGRLDCWWWRVVLATAFPHWPQAFAQRPQAAVAALRLLAKAGLEPAVRLELSRQDVFSERDDPVSRSDRTPARNSPSQPFDIREALIKPFDKLRTGDLLLPFVLNSSTSLRRALSNHEWNPFNQSIPSTVRPGQPGQFGPPIPGAAGTQNPSSEDTSSLSVMQAQPYQALPTGQSAAQAEPTPQPNALLATGNPPARPARESLQPVEPTTEQAPISRQAGQAKQAPSAPAATIDDAEIPPNLIPPSGMQSEKPRLSAEINRLIQGSRRLGALPVTTLSLEEAMLVMPTVRENDLILPDATLPPAEAALAYPPLAIDSAYAGAFFLVNILLGDGLYPDFTRPLDPGFPVPLWRLLALLTERLADAELRGDPLWNLLDQLAADLPVAEEADLADWPAPRVRHNYHAVHFHTRRHKSLRRLQTRAGAERLQDWLRRYEASVRIRLADAFAMPASSVGKFLVAQPARIHVSAGEIVVVHALDAYPVDIRLAGLDRDPGYLPSAGRTLRFLFV